MPHPEAFFIALVLFALVIIVVEVLTGRGRE